MLTHSRLTLAGGVLLILGAPGSSPPDELGWSRDGIHAGHCILVEAERPWSLPIRGLELTNLLTVYSQQEADWRVLVGNPEWSPDNTRLLFTTSALDGCTEITDDGTCSRNGRPGSQVWMFDASNTEPSSPQALVNHARNGTWSPDGTKIAFLSKKETLGPRALGVFDLEMGEEVILPIRPAFRGDDRVVWRDDGIVVGAASAVSTPSSAGGYLVNLDDLSAEDLGWPRVELDSFNSRSTALGDPWTFHVIRPSQFDRTLPYKPGLPPFFPHLSNWAGLWAVQDSSKYATLLVRGREPALSPDQKKLAFIITRQINNPGFDDVFSDVMIGDLVEPVEPVPTFSLDATALPGLVVGDALGVYSARTNPLNERVIGYLDVEFKGSVVVTQIEGGEARVRPLLDRGIIEPGDVAACPTDRRAWRGEASDWAVLRGG